MNLPLKCNKLKSKKKNKAICFILPGWATKKTGGSELQLYHLANKFVDEGWSVEVITTNGKVVYPEAFNNNIKYIYYNQKLLNFSRVFALVKLLLKLFKTKSYYYYVRTDARLERTVVWSFTRLMNRKYIFALAHDDDVKNISYYSKEKLKKKNFVKKLIGSIDCLIADLLSRGTIKADLVIVQNYFQKKYLLDKENLQSYIIPNSYFSEFLKSSDNKQKSIVWIANMRDFKRPEKYLEIVGKMKNSSFVFLMIGDCKKYCYLISKTSQNNFKYLGNKSYHEAEEYLKNSKVLINTSINEGFSNTFLQAWANKTWVITLGVDPDGIIKNNNIGDVCNSVNELVSKLRKLEKECINEKQLDKAQKYVYDRFSPSKNYYMLKKLLNELN